MRESGCFSGRSVHVSRQSGLRECDQAGKGLGIGDSELGQDLAVDVDLCQTQALDEAVVRDVVCTSCSVDTRDPQLAELALARTTVAVRVGERVELLLLGLGVQTRTLSTVAAGCSKN